MKQSTRRWICFWMLFSSSAGEVGLIYRVALTNPLPKWAYFFVMNGPVLS